ncbi:MAG: chloramphenicol acetyltransferase [Firmicutes bacterium]|nr:chloramphenicol acetyltransferase [Bacillota bacterium]
MNYKSIDKESYYRKGVFHHFTQDCKCSTSMTARLDVTELIHYSKETNSKFYINFLYLLSKVLNSRDDYKMAYLWQTEELICYEVINPIQYVFHEDTETITPVYTKYYEEYHQFYEEALKDIEKAKETREYGLDSINHPNWFDASYISWLSYDSLHIELPDGYLYFLPIVNWGKYREENGRFRMPVSVRLNHAIADGYLIANVFRLLEKEMMKFVKESQ